MTKEATSNKVIRKRATPKETISTLLLYFLATLLLLLLSPSMVLIHWTANYQTISLLSICNKILERHISQLLTPYLISSCPLSSSQWGFVTALLSVLHDWHQYRKGNCSLFLTFKRLLTRFPTIPCSVKLE